MNTAEFILAVQRAITVPTYQGRYSSDDFLALANEEMLTTVTPMLTSMRENYMVIKKEIPTVANVKEYLIPKRSLGSTLREIWYEETPGAVYNLPQIALEDSVRYENFGSGCPSAFYLRNDRVVLCPTPARAATLVIHYPLQPSKLVLSNRTMLINSFTNDSVTSLVNIPNNLLVGSTIDITSATPGYSLLVQDGSISALNSSTTLSITGYSPTSPLSATGLEVGDVLSLAGESSIVQLPDNVQLVLIYATAHRIVQGLGFPDQIQMIKEKLDRSIQTANELLQPRTEGELPKVIQANGLLRGRLTRRFPSVMVS